LHKDDVVSGRRNVKEALLSGGVQKLYLLKKSKHPSLEEITSLARSHEVPVETLPKEKFNSLVETSSHQGVAALVSSYNYLSWEDFHEKAERGSVNAVLMLDHLQDPHNMGALLRTAEAAGIKHVIIPRDRSVQINATVRKVAAGAAEWVSVIRVTNLVQAVRHLQDLNFWVYGTDDSGNTPYYNVDFSRRTVLVLGAEGKGLSRLLRENCDELVYIPMYGQIESLNVSVAGGILMYEFRRRLQAQEG